MRSVQLAVSPDNVLAYALQVVTDEPTTVSVEVTPEDTTVAPWTVTAAGDPVTENEIVIAGLRAESRYTLAITATNVDGGTAVDDTHSIATDPLPAELPPITIATSDPAHMASGFTVFGVFGWLDSGGTDIQHGWLIALDAEGQVVWYADTPNRPEDVRLLPDGNLGYSYAGQDNDGFIEIDRLDRVKNHWVATALGNALPAGAIAVNTDSIHHEVFPLANGHFLTLSSELRQISPAQCPNYDDTYNVVGDDIVEFAPDTGAIVQRISLFDVLDPCRRTDRGFAGGFWNATYGGITTKDWTHSNAVIYDPARKLAIVSVRHQDWLVGLHFTPGGGGADDGKVAWLLGDEGAPGDYGSYPYFTLTSGEWQYHQHAPEVMANGDILMFDNGNLRPGTNFDPNDPQGDADLPYSRVVQFHLDTSNMTVSQVWEWKAPDGNGGFLYCPFIGDADALDNGNVLATFGGAVDPPSDNVGAAANRKFGRIVELARGSQDNIVFDARVRDPATTGFKSYSVYRADRITGFPR